MGSIEAGIIGEPIESMENREEKFEKMLEYVQSQYRETSERMDILKSEDKIKTVTYKQLMAEKLKYQSILSIYKAYGLIEEY